MTETELLLSLAEIAGVFVGFGALIAVRSGGATTRSELSGLRWVMSTAIWVVIAALSPVFINRYGVAGHELWLSCSVLGLATYAVAFALNGFAPENRAETADTFATVPKTEIALVMGSTFWLPTLCLVLVVGLVGTGLFPDQEPALYLTAVGLGLFMSALHLFVMAFWGR